MEFDIGNKHIGKKGKAFIVAELSANHQQDLGLALKTIKAAKMAGADAVKIQTYTADTMTIDCRNEFFNIRHGTIWDGKTLYELYHEAHTPWEWHGQMKKTARELGMIFFSTPFDNQSADFLERLGVPAYKIASFEITDIPFIEHVAAKGKPVILSTGIASCEEIQEAVDAVRKNGNEEIAVLKCTSAYPAPPDEINLKTLPDITRRFGTVCGLSDHTSGIHVSVASIPLGAKIIERHLIMDRSMGGPDAPFSLEPREFKDMVAAIREVECALGEATYTVSENALKNRAFSRSLFVVEDVLEGEYFTMCNIRSIRPGYGMAPKYIDRIVGKRATRNIPRGSPMKWDMVEGNG